MSIMCGVLNRYLKAVEKRRLRNAKLPRTLRRSFELNARVVFRPRGKGFRKADIAGVTGLRCEGCGPLILYLHGGAYVFGSPHTHRAMLAQIHKRTGCAVFIPDYRKAPEYPFPAAFEDALAVYRELADWPDGVILGGDSAGGGLALALLAEIIRLELPKPLGAFAFSALTDCTASGDSIRSNAETDVVLPAERLPDFFEMVLQGADPKDPRISPLFARFHGAPACWLCAGDREILFDDTRRMARRLSEQGVRVTEVIARDLPHVWPIFHLLLPEARATLDEVSDWINGLGRPECGN